MVEARSDFAYRTANDRRRRVWPSLPIEMLVRIWLKRVDKNSSKFARPLRLELRQKHAEKLGVPTRWVELRQDGTLWHDSRSEAIATLADTQ